ncbi:hypothetical protein AKJ40_00885 [candidate division MSBL1 archaeon SCGC-AAA259M10]|uniref:AAA+ ATPase domain-containing protein n=1 Tax=candidate division MSBL1 archaeon SCGC-AAA259M10 TaxID=1698270 RepID=A0A133V2K9_9EURY|nr:hypothetical protein AKJ40_00885 [candidate division MSBL1 archaeon SCGC-AAA259M10]
MSSDKEPSNTPGSPSGQPPLNQGEEGSNAAPKSFDEAFREGLERARNRERLIVDGEKISPCHVPRELVHREEVLERVYGTITSGREGEVGDRILITGPVGAGKTSVAINLSRSIEKEENCPTCSHVDCRIWRTPHQILNKLASDLGQGPPDHDGGQRQALRRLEDRLEAGNSTLIAVLDHLGHHVRKRGLAVIRLIDRAERAAGPSGRIGVVGTAQSARLLARMRAESRERFGRNLVRLEGYGHDQMVDILERRAEKAYKPGAVGGEAIDLISKIAAGDARHAVALLRESGRQAEHRESSEVLPSHVEEAEKGLTPMCDGEVYFASIYLP